MIDTSAINNASNYLFQAGYTIKASAIPEVYSSALQSVVTIGLAVFAAIGTFGRAWQALKNEGSVLRAVFLGTNTPKSLVTQVNSNTSVLQGNIPVVTPPTPPTNPTTKTIIP